MVSTVVVLALLGVTATAMTISKAAEASASAEGTTYAFGSSTGSSSSSSSNHDNNDNDYDDLEVVIRWANKNDGDGDEDDEESAVSFLTNEIINPAYLFGERGIIAEPFQRASVREIQEWISLNQLLVITIGAATGAGAVAKTANKHKYVACVRVETKKYGTATAATTATANNNNDNEITMNSNTIAVKWGCLAVHPKHQGKGYARKLMHAIEEYAQSLLKKRRSDQNLKNQNGNNNDHLSGCNQVILQLELLVPHNWHHAHKERLRTWYTKSLGYELLLMDKNLNNNVDDNDKGKKRDGLPSSSLPPMFVEGQELMKGIVLSTDSDFFIYHKTISKII